MSEMLEKLLAEYIEKNSKLEQALLNQRRINKELENKKCYSKEHSQLLRKIQQVKEKLLNSDINKTGYNKYNDYYYFDLSDITPVIEKALLAQGCASKFYVNDDKMFLRIIDTETGVYDEWDTKLKIYTRDKIPKGDLTYLMKDEQAAQTYSRRTLWLVALDIVEPVPETPEANGNNQKKQEKNKNDIHNRPFEIPEGASESVKTVLQTIKKDFGNKVKYNNTTLRNKLNSLKKDNRISETDLQETVQTLTMMGYKV